MPLSSSFVAFLCSPLDFMVAAHFFGTL